MVHCVVQGTLSPVWELALPLVLGKFDLTGAPSDESRRIREVPTTITIEEKDRGKAS